MLATHKYARKAATFMRNTAMLGQVKAREREEKKIEPNTFGDQKPSTNNAHTGGWQG